MNTLGKVLGVSLLGLATAGCGRSLDSIDPKLKKYNTNNDNYIQDSEARLFWELEFDTNHDKKLSDEETLRAFDYLSDLPDTWTRDSMFKALADFRKESLEAKK